MIAHVVGEHQLHQDHADTREQEAQQERAEPDQLGAFGTPPAEATLGEGCQQPPHRRPAVEEDVGHGEFQDPRAQMERIHVDVGEALVVGQVGRAPGLHPRQLLELRGLHEIGDVVEQVEREGQQMQQMAPAERPLELDAGAHGQEEEGPEQEVQGLGEVVEMDDADQQPAVAQHHLQDHGRQAQQEEPQPAVGDPGGSTAQQEEEAEEESLDHAQEGQHADDVELGFHVGESIRRRRARTRPPGWRKSGASSAKNPPGKPVENPGAKSI